MAISVRRFLSVRYSCAVWVGLIVVFLCSSCGDDDGPIPLENGTYTWSLLADNEGDRVFEDSTLMVAESEAILTLADGTEITLALAPASDGETICDTVARVKESKSIEQRRIEPAPLQIDSWTWQEPMLAPNCYSHIFLFDNIEDPDNSEETPPVLEWEPVD